MSAAASLLSQPGIEAVFVPGRPARSGHLALWHPTRVPDSFTKTLELVLPAGTSVRQREVPATLLPVGAVIDALVDLPVDGNAGRSTHGWAAVTRGALHLIARGRLLPTVDEDGVDGWRIGPLDPDDLVLREALADALPAAAHATAVPGSAPRRVASPRWLVARYWDAVADAYVRTAAAPLAAGHAAFAAQEATAVRLVSETEGSGRGRAGRGEVSRWLTATSSSVAAQATVALRLQADGAPELRRTSADDENDDQPDGDRVTEDLPDGSGGAFRAVLEVGSVADRSLVLDAADLWAAPAAVIDRFGPTVEDDVLLTLRRGARVWAPMARLLDVARPDELELTGEEVADLLGPVADDLAGSGIEVRWPTTVLQGIDLKPVVVSESVGSDREGSLSFGAMCELRWTASVDGDELTEAELAMLVEAKRGVVRLRGKWVKADPQRLARIQKRRSISAGEALAAALSGELVVDGEQVDAEIQGPLAELGVRLAAHTASDRTSWEPPVGLNAELRPYQREGAAWLCEMAELGLGGVLADDMGLGKTVQFLALHLARGTQGGPTLVVCPVSVLGNWAREAARFAPEVPVIRYHGTDRSLEDLPKNAIVLTTYAMARRDVEVFETHQWGLIAADEAQAVKNPLSRTARALRRIPAGARFALTGTPVENRLVDLWSLLDWTTPGLLGPLDRFRREVALPVERERDAEAAASLARLVRPFLLRRRKSDPDIAPDLPPKTETDAVVPLTTEQRTLYQAMVTEVMAQVEAAEGMSRRGLVLKLLTGLKQICNHPAQFLKQGLSGSLAGRSGKLDAVTELVDTICAEGESVLVFTQFVAMGDMLAAHLSAPGRPTQFLHGGVPIGARQEMVDRFQAGEVPVFVISVKAGGTGLNLTQATHVIHYDRWWNPAVEDQASDRAWRIGQDRPVQVHRMVCEGTVEDKIAGLLSEKRALADAVITSGEGWVSELGDDDLRLLVALGADESDR
ncbi:MAG: DEAD/DEAH box helicase [Aquihabitans sp.]